MTLTLTRWPLCTNFTRNPWDLSKNLTDVWTSYVNAFESYCPTDRQTDRQTDTTEIIYHAASRVVRKLETVTLQIHAYRALFAMFMRFMFNLWAVFLSCLASHHIRTRTKQGQFPSSRSRGLEWLATPSVVNDSMAMHGHAYWLNIFKLDWRHFSRPVDADTYYYY